MKREIILERCKRTDKNYVQIRDRHYVSNKGSIGQQLHYLIYLDNEIVGIISGGSAVYAVKCRDDFFGITKENRNPALNSIINNTVFRLEKNEPNLATQIMSMWRKQVAKDWEEKYRVKVHGFETFVVPESYRVGTLYLADNWTYLGETSGNTKVTNGIQNKQQRISVCKKLVFGKKIPNTSLCTFYESTWHKRYEKCTNTKQQL